MDIIECCNCKWQGTEDSLILFDDEDGGGYGCPNCKTDKYLSDKYVTN